MLTCCWFLFCIKKNKTQNKFQNFQNFKLQISRIMILANCLNQPLNLNKNKNYINSITKACPLPLITVFRELEIFEQKKIPVRHVTKKIKYYTRFI